MAEFLQTAPEILVPTKSKKKRYADILRTKFPKKGLRGGQEVPMDIDKINASFAKTQE